MEKQKFWAKVTLWVERGVGALLVALVFLLPAILRCYIGFLFMLEWEQQLLTGLFYCCVVIIGWALWNLDCLLRGILAGEVFVRKNVRCLRWVQWSCGLVSLITGIAGIIYIPLIALAVIMAFLCLTISVVSHVMDAAVTIREENDLTI
ncbi:MAG: DUF2975 domain-containing protein [Ruminococcaceae bacterium]|nr:DUF2975 domain-containing protein [Oscillospiraceae bacterium]MBQ3215557.1 DUF2975 domain-containing protein [Oscillospiraceae bacterium]